MLWILELFLHLSEILYNSGTVAPVTVSHTCHFGGVLDRLSTLNHIISLDTVLTADTEKFSVARISHHAHFDAILGVFGQLLRDLHVGPDFNLLTRQVIPYICHFCLIDEEGDATLVGATLWVEEQVGEEDRVVIDIGAAHICHPSNVVQSRDQERFVLSIFDLRCNLSLLLLRCLASELYIEKSHRLGGTCWSLLSPDDVDEVGHGFEDNTFQFQAFSLRLLALRRVLREVETDDLVRNELALYPICPRYGTCFQFHHLPAGLKLASGLQVVPAVGPHLRLVFGDDGEAVGARKATDELDPLVTFGDILAIVLVHMEADVCLQAMLLHQSSDTIKFLVICFDHLVKNYSKSWLLL